MAAFYPVNEIETLIYLNECIDCIEQVKLNASDINIEVGKNNQTVHDRIINILGGFAYSKNIDSALDLLFKYYLKRPDMYIQFYHASIMNYSIQRDSYTFDYQCQIKYLSKIIEYSDDWSNPYITILFLDVVKAFLQLTFSPVEESVNGKGMVLCHITPPLTAGSKTYRKIIWEEIGNIAHSKQHIELIKAILKDYGHTSFGKNHNVIQYDAPYILNIVPLILSPNVLAD